MAADDNRLIADCRDGNTAAFGELVSRYQDRLFNSVLRLSDNAEDARDVVQEAFLHAYQSLQSFKGDALFYLAIPHCGQHGHQHEAEKTRRAADSAGG